MIPLDLLAQLKRIPSVSGIYQYFDKENKLLYVGKAKNLKKRVDSYFQKRKNSKKLLVLVGKIARIEYVLTENEYEALLLENNLIKEHKPIYNIQLRDDKTYPWICLKNEPFPRIFLTRKFIKDGSEYYGPYASIKIAQALLSFIKDLYSLRSCHLDLHPSKISEKKYKVCLEYHIKNCKGPCESLQTEQQYERDIKSIRHIIRGHFQESLRFMRERMFTQAKKLNFEEAQEIKEKISLLKKYQSRSVVVNPLIDNVDVFSLLNDEQYAYVNFMKIAHGSIIQSYNLELRKKLDEKDEDLLGQAVIHIRELFKSNSKEMYLSTHLTIEIPGVKITIPKIGDKKKIIELSLRNLKHYRQERLEQLRFLDPAKSTSRIMKQTQKDLRLEKEPRYIECFDNSNLQGSHAVSACVVFKDGKPSKKDYRSFTIKSLSTPDDFASMKEVVYRRYKSLLELGKELPTLIVIDGGKGQLSSAYEVLKTLNLENKIQILSIAKRLEEIYFPNDPIALYLDKTSESLKLIQQIRDEAHRFGLSHHRGKRSKAALTSELNSIVGIGEKSREILLAHFKSFKAISKAQLKELEPLIGISRAKKLHHYFLNTQK